MICRYTCFFTACIIMAYEALHTKGFVYRDMKPANVLIKDDGYAGDVGHLGIGPGLRLRVLTTTTATHVVHVKPGQD